jgi:hypothetical protein
MELEPVVPFFALPALDTFVCFSGPEPDDKLENLPGSSNVKHIKVLLSFIPTHILQTLVRASRSLQTFMCYPIDALSWGTDLHVPSLGDALRECAMDTLQHPEIKIADFPPTLSLGPLCDFVQLTHVSAPLSSLPCVPSETRTGTMARRLSEILPKLLVSLVISIHDRSWINKGPKVVAELVKIRHERLVPLKSLTVWRDHWGAPEAMNQSVAEGVEFSRKRHIFR